MKLLLLLLLCSTTLFLNAQIILNDGFEEGNAANTPPNAWFCQQDGWLSGQGELSHGRLPHSGEWYAYLSYGKQHWMFAPVEFIANKQYEFSMWYKTDGNTGFNYKICYGDTSATNLMQNEIVALAPIENHEYQQVTVRFTATESASTFLGIYGEADNTPWYLCVDDIFLRKINNYEFKLSRVNADTSGIAGEHYDYFVAIENMGLNDDIYQIASSSNWSATVLDKNGQNEIGSISIPAFECDTFIVRQTIPANAEYGSVNSNVVTLNSDNSAAINELTISTTAENTFTDFPLIEGFENNIFPPMGWRATIVSGAYNFTRTTLGSTPECTPHDDSEGMAFYKSFSAQSGESAVLSSPELLLNNEDYIVRFWFYRTDNIASKADKIEVYTSEDRALTNATLLGTVHRTIGMSPIESENGWYEYSFLFTGNSTTNYIAFKAISDYGWNMYVDDVRIMLDVEDTAAPEFISVNELSQYADLDIPVELVVRDDSEVKDTISGIYTIGDNSESFSLFLNDKTKGNFKYTGNIPAQANGTVGSVKFIMEDVFGNAAESESFTISWAGIAPLLEESFEGEFPAAGWEIISEPFTWYIWSQESGGLEMDSDGIEYTVTPPHGEKHAALHWDFYENEQDEWLISPEVEISDSVDLTFETFAQFGSYDYDHYIVKISTNHGASWTTLWDAFFMDNRVIMYDETIVIPLSEYIGENVRIAWHAYNDLYANIWYAWYIDDVKIEKPSTKYSVTFNVRDENNEAIADALVHFNGENINTDAAGQAIFTEVAAVENASYIVSKTGEFEDYVGSLSVVDQNVVENVSMTATEIPTYTVTFTVSDDLNNAAADALVSFNGTTALTSSDGVAIFSAIEAMEGAVYSVTKENYKEYTDTLSVIDQDVNMAISLETISAIENSNANLVVYPNPTKNSLYISGILNHAHVVVYNVMGEELINTTIESSKDGIDFSGLDEGLYLIEINQANSTIIKKIRKE